MDGLAYLWRVGLLYGELLLVDPLIDGLDVILFGGAHGALDTLHVHICSSSGRESTDSALA